MFLHLYKGKNSDKFRFKILRKSKGTLLKSNKKFQSKKLRKQFLKSLFNNSYKLKSVVKRSTRNGLYYFSVIDFSGNELARSKKYKKKEKRNLRRKEYLIGIKQLGKNSIFKKRKTVDKERQILKKGRYPLGHYDYSIFLSSNGKHYFTFKDNDGKTALLNSNIQGFKTLSEAEVELEEVIKHAKDASLYDIRETKNGKFFFYLFNKKNQKIAKSFFFGDKRDAENVISKFVGSKPKIEVKTKKENSPTKVSPPIAPISVAPKNNPAPKENIANDLLTDRERYLKQKELERIKLEKELEERREKRRLERLEKEKKEKAIAATKEPSKNQNPTSAYYNEDDDGFGGCLKWILGIFSLLALILLAIWLFKGCGDNKASKEPIAYEAEILDSTSISSDTIVNSNDNNSVVSDSDDEISNGKSSGQSDAEKSQSDENQNKNYSETSCGCSNSIEIFKVPSNGQTKSITSLTSNPQFGSLPGNSGSDLIDDLKYQARLSRSNSSFLRYLFESMGYDGLSNLKAKDIKLEFIPSGSKGVMGFGKYNGYKYVSLDLPKSQLEAFKIVGPNGCTIYITKSGGNFFYPCE